VLYAELHRVRRDGVAHDREEAVEGLACVATAIHDVDGSVCAAISIAAPVDRFTVSATAYRSAVIRAARAVTERLRLPLGERMGGDASPG
jgi:DNA-binding IclR family transcriptional regulator